MNLVTISLDNLHTTDATQFERGVVITNGNCALVTKSDHSIFNCDSKSIRFNDILCLPTITKNLLSIHKLCKDNDFMVVLYVNDVCVKECTTKEDVVTGGIHNGLYRLELDVHFHSQVNTLEKASLTLWHEWLGHGYERKVRSMIDQYNLPISSLKF